MIYTENDFSDASPKELKRLVITVDGRVKVKSFNLFKTGVKVLFG